jgi:hypothetical protein
MSVSSYLGQTIPAILLPNSAANIKTVRESREGGED